MVALRLRLSYLAAAVAYTPGRERETTSLLPPDGGDGAADTMGSLTRGGGLISA